MASTATPAHTSTLKPLCAGSHQRRSESWSDRLFNLLPWGGPRRPEFCGDGRGTELPYPDLGRHRRQGLPGGFWQPGIVRAFSFRNSTQTAESIRIDLCLYGESGAAAHTGENQPAEH